MIESFLKITRFDQELKIENLSDYTIEICRVPVNNRRKVLVDCIISPNRFWIVTISKDFDLKQFFFRFTKGY